MGGSDVLIVLASVATGGVTVGLLVRLYRRHPILRYYSVRARPARKGRARLLYETDHHALLAACQEVVDYCAESLPHEEHSQHVPLESCPSIIRDLKPRRVLGHRIGAVLIEMSDRPAPFGVRTWSRDCLHYPPVA